MPVAIHNAGVLHWWQYDLPREHEKAFRRYVARNKQYLNRSSTKNTIPFPELVTPDMARWWAPGKNRWVTYNAQPQGLVTALERGWLPEAPANAVVDSGETPEGVATGESGVQAETDPRTTCDVPGCGRSGFASSAGVKLHKTRMHPVED